MYCCGFIEADKTSGCELHFVLPLTVLVH